MSDKDKSKSRSSEAKLAADVIRQKLAGLYSREPSPKQELTEAEAAGVHRSKHQQFIHNLRQSGKSVADIQTEWHQYYTNLPDDEKHAVWREFYNQQPVAAPEPRTASRVQATPTATEEPDKKSAREHDEEPATEKHLPTRTGLRRRVSKQTASARLKHRQKLHSLLFGLGAGVLVVFVLLFGFFNERFIAPFITPSRAVSSTPIIIDPSSTAVGKEPLIIIPKINVEIPVVYDEPSIDEAAVQKALERGVIHYATTPNPGEKGNGVIFGHSSNNIFNQGRYKFAFVLLKRLEKGDTFMLQKNSRRYIYRVYDKRIVKPEDVSVLDTQGKPATFTLITCDPPGTSTNRLVVIGEQISPNPNNNIASHVHPKSVKPRILPSNAPSLWHRLISWLTG